MKLFDLSIRLLIVGAISIIFAAIYVGTAHAVDRVVINASQTCPSTHIDGFNNLYCYKWNDGVLATALPSRIGAVLLGTVTCNIGEGFHGVFRFGTTTTGYCLSPSSGGVVGGANGFLSVTYPDTEQTAMFLAIANVFVMLGGISFGWRMSIRPPVGIME